MHKMMQFFFTCTHIRVMMGSALFNDLPHIPWDYTPNFPPFHPHNSKEIPSQAVGETSVVSCTCRIIPGLVSG